MSGAGTAAARWLAIHDELLRGVTHAFSNRVATIGAAAYMLEHGDVPLEQSLDTLRTESERMDTLLQQLRQLPQRLEGQPEPMTVNDACLSAVRLHAHHGELRDFECDIAVDEDVYPIWAEPHALTHALLVALTAAKRNALPGSRIVVRATGDVQMVRIGATGAPTVPAGVADVTTDAAAAADEADAGAAAWLLARHGGTARAVDHGIELEVPTLLAVRRARKG